jgi:hypothetical protein
MRKMVLRLAVLAGAVLTLGACADSPTQTAQQRAPDFTASAQDEQVAPQGCVVEGLCVLPPISGGWCDPYEELDGSCDDENCMTSAGEPTGPKEAITVQSCPGGGDGDPEGGGTPPPSAGADPICPMADDGSCIPEEEESTICPSNFLGNTQPTLITVAGRNHEFQFSSTPTHPFELRSTARSPAIYEIGFPTTSKDSWWIARAGTITVYCRGVYVTRSRHWLGIVTVVGSDLHMVMGPGHPDF